MVDRDDGSGDGHGTPTLTQGIMDGAFRTHELPSAIKEFVHPGRDIENLLMRAAFKDERQLNAAILFYDRCEEFGDERHKKLLFRKVAGSVSINGARAQMLLQAVVGQLEGQKQAAREKAKSMMERLNPKPSE